MLKVTKIIEGGIDLETNQELPRTIVVSNGHREVNIPANDNVIRQLIRLFAENSEPQDRITLEGASHYVEPTTPPSTDVSRTSLSPQPVNTAPSLFDDPKEEPSEIEDGDFEPGEAFNDGGTGAGSL